MNTQDSTNSALDAALEMTFPASDPIAVYAPEQRPGSGGEDAAKSQIREER